MDKPLQRLAALLPDSLDESIAVEIAKLVSDIVNEQVEARVKILESKVHGFLRMNVEKIKEHALAELKLENEDVRDALVYRELKALFVDELEESDQVASLKDKNHTISELQEEVTALTEELTNLVTDNEKLKTTSKALSSKVASLTETLRAAKKGLETLKESAAKPFKSSERGEVVSRVDEGNNDNPKKVKKVQNSLISEASLALMPKKGDK